MDVLVFANAIIEISSLLMPLYITVTKMHSSNNGREYRLDNKEAEYELGG